MFDLVRDDGDDGLELCGVGQVHAEHERRADHAPGAADNPQRCVSAIRRRLA